MSACAPGSIVVSSPDLPANIEKLLLFFFMCYEFQNGLWLPINKQLSWIPNNCYYQQYMFSHHEWPILIQAGERRRKAPQTAEQPASASAPSCASWTKTVIFILSFFFSTIMIFTVLGFWLGLEGFWLGLYVFLSDPGVHGVDLWVQDPLGLVSLTLSETFCWLIWYMTLADEDTKSILTDNANREIQGNVVMYAGGQICK